VDMQAVSDDAGISESGAESGVESGVVNDAGNTLSSDNEMYIVLAIRCFSLEGFMISSLSTNGQQAAASDDGECDNLAVMSQSCQDPLLVRSYVNLPILPYVVYFLLSLSIFVILLFFTAVSVR